MKLLKRSIFIIEDLQKPFPITDSDNTLFSSFSSPMFYAKINKAKLESICIPLGMIWFYLCVYQRKVGYQEHFSPTVSTLRGGYDV